LFQFAGAGKSPALQPNAVLSILQGNAGVVELYLRSGEKVEGELASNYHLSHLTGAEFYDAFVDVKDISKWYPCGWQVAIAK
jgi:hypothetical protein